MIEPIDEYNQYAYFKHTSENTFYRQEQHTLIPGKVTSSGLIRVSLTKNAACINYSFIEYIYSAPWVEPCSKEEFSEAIEQFLTIHNLTK